MRSGELLYVVASSVCTKCNQDQKDAQERQPRRAPLRPGPQKQGNEAPDYDEDSKANGFTKVHVCALFSKFPLRKHLGV